MCIAIVKEKGFNLPAKDILKNCWDNNPDGAGIMFNDGIEVHGYKGFTTFKGFYKFLKKLDFMYDLKEKDLVLHFRIATHGGICKENTHPFPVTNDDNLLRALNWTSKYGFAHNGIIFGYGSKTQGGLSDTMEYIKYIINSIPDLENAETLIHNLACEHSSRFAVMLKDGVYVGGDWVEKDGILYSNNTYKKYTPIVTYKWDFAKKYDYYENNYVDSSYNLCDDELCDKDELICEECGKITDKLYKFYGENVCEDCKTSLEDIIYS